MADYDRQYPGYGFAQHAGYGTKAHLAALAAQGVTPIHQVICACESAVDW